LKNLKALGIAVLIALSATLLTGCDSAADTASQNLSTAADQFEIDRTITFYNGITGEWFATVKGYCSINDSGEQLEVTCKVADNQYTKDFLGLSDNVTYFAFQNETADVSLYHRRLLVRPEAILPDIELDIGQQ